MCKKKTVRLNQILPRIRRRDTGHQKEESIGGLHHHVDESGEGHPRRDPTIEVAGKDPPTGPRKEEIGKDLHPLLRPGSVGERFGKKVVWNKFLKQRNVLYKDFQLYLYMIFFDVYFGNVSGVLSAGQIDPVSQDQRRITNKKQRYKQDFTKGFHNLSGSPAGGTGIL